MIGRGLFILTVLSNCVLSLPVTSSQLENEDVKVLKCIVEALADVLSRPHPVPVSQECLVTLKTDDRLVSILRHHNFLKELQEIAVQGGKERNQLQQDAGIPDPTTQGPQTTDAGAADRSMLEALGGPGERSILSQKKRTGNVDEDKDNNESLRDGESQEDNDSTEEIQGKSKNDESPGSHVSESVDEWSEGKARMREEDEEEEEEHEEKKANSEENSEEENTTKDEKAAGSDQKRHAPGNESKEEKFHEEDEEETDKRSVFSSHKHEEEEVDEREMKRGSKERLKQWTKRGKGLQQRKKADGKQVQEVPHHSKEVTEEEDEDEEEKKRDTQRSPEEKELQVIAQKAPEDRRVLEEEGSASRKTEEPEIESLAAIESELENVAQKLHELRRG